MLAGLTQALGRVTSLAELEQALAGLGDEGGRPEDRPLIRMQPFMEKSVPSSQQRREKMV